MPKISVIVPVYNCEKYLQRCLDSLINQTFKDIEIIAVNDGSTDNSGIILEEYGLKDNRIKIINKENGGLSSARNIGLENVTSEFITFVDSDDWFELNALEKAYNEMKDDIDIVCFYSNIIKDGVEKDNIDIIKAEKYHKIKYTGLKDVDDDIVKETTVTCWNKLFRKSILDKYKINFPQGRLFEDNPFTYSYLTHCKKAFYIGECLHNYVQRPNSIMDKLRACKLDAVIDNLYVFDILYNHLKEYKLLSKYKKLLTCMYSCHLWRAYCYAPAGRKELTLKIATEFAKKYNEKYFLTPAIKYVKQGKYKFVSEIGGIEPIENSFLENVFSIKNHKREDKTYKVVTVFGFKIKFQRRKKCLRFQ